ncbi:trypsin-like serine protease [Stenotrophomonas sp. CFBP 13725]|uniref:S1 family peptidase n=1 Tax=Stenotrophomonas sp. CFBP 13725 TaxID=2775297 RepID=UPI00177D963B|nr:trypsin-like serine protease [Stenotrophomonas sp. CFBP 13725]MBD8637102.1 trypsin-like serine protease [Stenotrophomonas sp. CFBP 13725]
MRIAAIFLLLLPFGANAVVGRDDVPDLHYRMAAAEFPALVDLPGEGHGVLIADQWVVTAAHAVSWQKSLDVVVVGGTPRAVSRVLVHPAYRSVPQEVVESALRSGEWEAFFDLTAASDDIALIQLTEPVHDVEPARIYEGSALGETVRIMGRGATGVGSKGHHLHGPNRTDLRQGYNQITISEGRWIGYVFDRPPNAHALEATTGSGDSGGPILVRADDEWHVAGIAAWKRAQVEGLEIHPGKYGETSYGVRLSNYEDWISETIGKEED